MEASTRGAKSQLINDIVRMLRWDIGARFLKRKGKTLVEIDEINARAKVGHAMRDTILTTGYQKETIEEAEMFVANKKRRRNDLAKHRAVGQAHLVLAAAERRILLNKQEACTKMVGHALINPSAAGQQKSVATENIIQYKQTAAKMQKPSTTEGMKDDSLSRVSSASASPSFCPSSSPSAPPSVSPSASPSSSRTPFLGTQMIPDACLCRPRMLSEAGRCCAYYGRRRNQQDIARQEALGQDMYYHNSDGILGLGHGRILGLGHGRIRGF
jgi:hypothetical protein